MHLYMEAFGRTEAFHHQQELARQPTSLRVMSWIMNSRLILQSWCGPDAHEPDRAVILALTRQLRGD